MNKTMKKMLSFVMIVLMVFSAVPMTAFAVDWRCTLGNHNYGWVVTTEPTCTQPGVSTEMCIRGEGCTATTSQTKAVDAKGHTPTTIAAKEPTCTVEGNTEGSYCSVCKEVLVACQTVASKGHTPEAYDAVEATCVADGKTAGTKCSVCQENISGGSTILAKGHVWKMQSYTAPNCKTSTPGSQTDKCLTCGEVNTYAVEYSHNYGSWSTTTQPTCSAPGENTRICKDCGHKDTLEIKQLDCTPESYEAIAPTCTIPGSKAGTRCKVCKRNLTGGEPVNAVGHTLVTANGKAATCTEKGTTDGIFCSKCDYIQQAMVEIAATGHKMVKDETKSYAASCTATGLYVEKCTNTNCAYTTTEVLPISHNGNNLKVEKNATCTEDGLKTGYCSGCKKTVVEVIPATGHKITSELSWKTVSQASCNKEGVQEAKCEIVACGQKATRAIPVTAHKEVIIPGTPATCQKAGLSDGKYCDYCGETLVKQEAIPLADHTYGEWKITKDATCAASGVKEAACTVCGAKKTEAIDRLKHTEVEIPAVAATCTKEGNLAGLKCSVCGTVTKEPEAIPALDHDWVDSGKSVPATCTQPGVDDYKCSRCTETKQGEVPAKGHDVEVIAGTPADCTLTGVQDAEKCKVCGVWVKEQVTLPALGHDWILVTEKSTPATCTATGINFYDCSRCDATDEQVAEKTEHAWTEWIIDVEATCQTTGHKYRECTVCKLYDDEDISNGGGHNTVEIKPVPATCTAPGSTGGSYCDKCNTVFTQPTEIPQLDHNYVTTVEKFATISQSGLISTECSYCGDIYKETVDKISSVKLETSKVIADGEVKTPVVIATDEAGEVLVEGTDYEVSYDNAIIDADNYDVKVTFKGSYSGTTTLTYTVTVGKTASLSRTSTAKGTMKLSWKAVEGAEGYSVFIYNEKGAVKKLASVKTTSYTATKDYYGKALKVGNTYKVAVRAYSRATDDNSVIYAAKYVIKNFVLYPAKINPTVTSTSKGKTTIKWANVAGETGYQVWYSTSKNGKYVKLSNYAANKTSTTTTKFKSGKTVYVKVRAYTKVGNSYVYGTFGNPVAVKVK